MEFDAIAFSNILKTLCGYYGSINKLADKTGITASYICKLTKLKYEEAPSPKILRKIADNSDGLFTYLELMYICGYFTSEEYSILPRKENKMRNPDRIPEILKELEEFWKQVPDWRLGQVISNFSYELTGNNDPFYIEDNKLLELLQSKNKKV